VELGVDQRIVPVMIETDCEVPVNIITEYAMCSALECVTMEEVKSSMVLLQVQSITYCSPDANTAAHVVAQFVAHEHWLEADPSWLAESVQNDIPVTH
jgi:hypothetical protein